MKPGCVGKLPAHMHIRDANGHIVTEPGVVGEIYGWQKHPRRYWNDPEATAQSFKGGWTKTSDFGFVDAVGDRLMHGRSTELSVRSGYTIAPLALAHALLLHTAWRHAAGGAGPP